jgi:hypothetical protein
MPTKSLQGEGRDAPARLPRGPWLNCDLRKTFNRVSSVDVQVPPRVTMWPIRRGGVRRQPKGLCLPSVGMWPIRSGALSQVVCWSSHACAHHTLLCNPPTSEKVRSGHASQAWGIFTCHMPLHTPPVVVSGRVIQQCLCGYAQICTHHALAFIIELLGRYQPNTIVKH